MEFLNCCEFVSSQFHQPGAWEVPGALFQPCRAEAKTRKENTRRVWNAASLSLLGAEGKSFSQEIRLSCVKCWNLGS